MSLVSPIVSGHTNAARLKLILPLEADHDQELPLSGLRGLVWLGRSRGGSVA